MHKLQLLAQEALANNHDLSSWVVPWWTSVCKTPASINVIQAVQLSVDDQQLLSLSFSVFLVWTDVETVGVAEVADGGVVQTGIADAILQLWMIHDSRCHVF